MTNHRPPITDRRSPITFHSLVWLLWLAAGVATVSTNPLLNLLVMAQAVLIALACHSESPVGNAFGLFVRLGALLVLVRTLLGAIPVGGFSYGGTTVAILPQLHLPIWLGGLQIGGRATLEMMAGGFVSGVRLWALILVFGAFNAVADHYALLRRIPRFLFHAGLAATIALAFVPQVVLQLQAIRDAQRVRGHRFRSWRDALPLLVPVLAGGLERSIQLAEAMDSRGYGRTIVRRRGAGWAQLANIAGLTLLALGLYASLTGDARGWLAVALGGGLTFAALRWMSGGTIRTRYFQERWHRRDTLAGLASCVALIGCIALRLTHGGGLIYTTLPRLSLPRFEPLVGALLLLLSMPALIELLIVEGAHERRAEPRHPHLADRS
jgi:energy-coupling factor transport system permease protein